MIGVYNRTSELARILTKGSPFSAAYAIAVHSVSISVEIRARSVGIILSRSSIASRGVLIHSGVIDPDAEDLKIIISNLTDDPLFLDNQNAVVQILILLSETTRTGRDGFH